MQLDMKQDRLLYIIAIVSGAIVWAAISAISGRNEAWDSPAYVSIGIPVICALSAMLGFVSPQSSWRWGITPFVGQFLWMLLTQGLGNLLPLGVLAFGIFSVPSIITARIGAFIQAKYAQQLEKNGGQAI